MVWRVWGEGRPLVLLHGASGSWTHWIRNVLPLSRHARVCAADMPGFGDSDAPPEPHTANGLADLVVEALERVVEPFAAIDLAGFSFGGIIAGIVAARLGARVETLVLIGPGGMNLRYTPPPTLRRVDAGDGADAIERAHRENLAAVMIAQPDRIDALAVFLHAENVRRARFKSGTIPISDALLLALPAVRARIAGIWGERDAFVGPYVEDRRRLLATFQPDPDFRVIAGAGHWVPYEAADDVNAALREILYPRA